MNNFSNRALFEKEVTTDGTSYRPHSSAPSSPTNGDTSYADSSGWNPLGDKTAGCVGYEEGSWMKL